MQFVLGGPPTLPSRMSLPLLFTLSISASESSFCLVSILSISSLSLKMEVLGLVMDSMKVSILIK